MSKVLDDNVTVKLGAHSYFIEVTAPLLRLFRKQKPDPVLGVARRFLSLFADHGVPVAQIPRLMPEISLTQLQYPEKLLEALTPPVIEEAAKIFGVRREWLEGSTWRMYEPYRCYKAPEWFFDELKTMKTESVLFPAFALCIDKKFGDRNRGKQPLTLVLHESVGTIGGNVISRYKVFDQMDWNYSKCRDQILAMIRLYFRVYQTPVPLYAVSKNDLNAVDGGFMVPRIATERGEFLHDVSLEDFSMFRDESAASREDPHLRCAVERWGEVGLNKKVEELFGRPLGEIKKTGCNHA